jgi:RNA polymerase sigma-70 factor, ECF subfamily
MENDANHGDVTALGRYAFWLVAAQPHLRRLAMLLTENENDAADLVQATNLRAWEKRTLFVRGAAADLRRWLFRIMGNLRRDIWRRDSRCLPSGWLDDVPVPEVDPTPGWATVAEDDLNAAMNSLRPCLREVYRLYAIERHSYATISSRLRIPRATVATRIYRARRRLRATLAGPAAAA